jgi:hypothetical protein
MVITEFDAGDPLAEPALDVSSLKGNDKLATAESRFKGPRLGPFEIRWYR